MRGGGPRLCPEAGVRIPSSEPSDLPGSSSICLKEVELAEVDAPAPATEGDNVIGGMIGDVIIGDSDGEIISGPLSLPPLDGVDVRLYNKGTVPRTNRGVLCLSGVPPVNFGDV